MTLNIPNMAKAGITKGDLCDFLAKWRELFDPQYLNDIAFKYNLEF